VPINSTLKVTIFIAILAVSGFLFSSLPLSAKKSEVISPTKVITKLSKLPEKERLAVLVYAEHTANYTLAAIAQNNEKQFGSMDEIEEIRLAVEKNKYFQQLQEGTLPGKFGTYYREWISTLKGYLTGKVTFTEFRSAQKKTDPKLENILKAQFTAEEASKLAEKHKDIIQEISASFYNPSLKAVYTEQLNDVREFAKSGTPSCLPVDKKSKNCGLTSKTRSHITKLNKVIAKGQGRIYRTLRIGDKFVIYVVLQKTKDEMKAEVKNMLKENPKAMEATYTILTMRSLCGDKNFLPILKKNKWLGQVVIHSRDVLPIYNVQLKDCQIVNQISDAQTKSK